MTERLADIGEHIEGVRQLGAVVNAMRGIAAARARQARSELAAVDGYLAIIGAAMGSVISSVPEGRIERALRPGRLAIVLFCAEQGFAGAFSERILDAFGTDGAGSELFLIGTRGAALASERGIATKWTSAMPCHPSGISRFADHAAEALYARIFKGKIDRIDAVYSDWEPGHGIHVERRMLLPLDMKLFAPSNDANPPLLNLPPEDLLNEVAADYLHAQLCNAALHALAAENEARMESMAAARSQIDRKLTSLQARQRMVRQEEITAEIIELAAGETASHTLG